METIATYSERSRATVDTADPRRTGRPGPIPPIGGRRRVARRVLPLVLTAVAVALTGCGSQSTDAAQPTATAEATSTTATATGAASGAPAQLTPTQRAELDAIRAAAGVQRTTFVGQVEGTTAYIAVVTTPTDATVYVCDEGNLGLWFTGQPASDGSLKSVHPSGASVELTLAAGEARGSVAIDGVSHPFVAETAVYPAGLWEGFDIEPALAEGRDLARYGWIVLADGTQRGSKVQTTAATSNPGDLDTVAGTGADGTAAGPSTPPPPAPATSLKDRCTTLKNNANLLIGDLFPPRGTVDEKLKGLLVKALDTTTRTFDILGCEGVVGPI